MEETIRNLCKRNNFNSLETNIVLFAFKKTVKEMIEKKKTDRRTMYLIRRGRVRRPRDSLLKFDQDFDAWWYKDDKNIG